MCWKVHNVHFCIHLHIHVFFREHACVCISMCISAFAMSHVQCVCACAMCYVLCAMCHVPCVMCHVMCMSACAMCPVPVPPKQGEMKPKYCLVKTTPPISTSSPPHYPSTFSTQRKPLTWWIVCHIISVTCSSFNVAEGILNHDIFLFVPNISTKALPWQKYQQKISLGSNWPNLFIQFTKIQST